MLKGWEFASDNLNLESSILIKDRQTRVYVTRLIDDLTLTSLQFRGGHFEFWIRDRLLRGLELNILRKPLGVRSVRDRMYRCLSFKYCLFRKEAEHLKAGSFGAPSLLNIFIVESALGSISRRSLVSGLRPSPVEERGLLSRTAAGDRAPWTREVTSSVEFQRHIMET